MTHFFPLYFSDLNMLAESEVSEHLDFHEHSKGELQLFCNSTRNMEFMESHFAPTTVPTFSVFPNELMSLAIFRHFSHIASTIAIYSSHLSQVRPCITHGLFLFYVCITLEILDCSQKSYHTIQPWFPTWSWFLLPSSFWLFNLCIAEEEQNISNKLFLYN